jgi:hypothetical protein
MKPGKTSAHAIYAIHAHHKPTFSVPFIPFACAIANSAKHYNPGNRACPQIISLELAMLIFPGISGAHPWGDSAIRPCAPRNSAHRQVQSGFLDDLAGEWPFAAIGQLEPCAAHADNRGFRPRGKTRWPEEHGLARTNWTDSAASSGISPAIRG